MRDIILPVYGPMIMPANPTALLILAPIVKYNRKILMEHRRECRFKNHSKKYRYRKLDTGDYDSFAENYSERDNLTVNFIEERRVAFEKQSTDLATELIKTVSGGIDYTSSIHDFAHRHPSLKR